MPIWLYNHVWFPLKRLFWCRYETTFGVGGKRYYCEWHMKGDVCSDVRYYEMSAVARPY